MKISVALLALWPLALSAQDTRTVTEPVIPPVCASLGAKLAVVDGRTVAPEDENKLDTKRIQQALDGCPAGKAVELKADGSSAAFLAGPLQLRAGVTLLVSKGAVLFASRDPREFDIAPGACGIVNTRGRGCKPLIAGDSVAGAAVMGDGVIDGRGWAKLTGQTVSWWDLAQQAKVQNANQNCPRILVLQRCNNFTLYRITLKNSPNFHVSYNGGNGFTAWGVIIDTPRAGRNTDGIDSKPEEDLGHSPSSTEKDHFQEDAGGRGTIDLTQLWNRAEREDRRQQNQSEEGPGEPGILPRPAARVFHGERKARVHYSGHGKNQHARNRARHTCSLSSCR